MVLQPRVVVPLHHPERVFLHVFARHKPRRVLAHTALPFGEDGFEFRAFGLDAANAQALALSQRVKTQALMGAQHASFGVFDGAGLFGDVAVEEIPKGALANEANAGRVLLLGIGQANLVGNPAHFGFLQLTDRKERFGQLRLVQAVQKVALVLARIQALEEFVLV